MTVWHVGVDAPTVQAAVDLAREGDVVDVPAGRWPGPVDVDKAITVSGVGTITGDVGVTVLLSSPGAVFDGISVDGSGPSIDNPDSCVRIGPDATGAIVRDTTLTNCAFGIWVHSVDGARIVGNHVSARPGPHPAERGNGIQLFDSEHLVVTGNVIDSARDGIYVSATHDSLIADNHVSNLRYGIHYMYSLRNTIRGNVADHDSGGIALMQSTDLIVEDNVASDDVRQGILFRDSERCRVTGNTVERDGVGMFIYGSTNNLIAGNRIAGNVIGLHVWAGTTDNDVHGNLLIGNRQQVNYVAMADERWGDAQGGQYWSDYLGWDQDGDGIGDRPYRVDSLTANLLFRDPAAVLLLTSPTLELLGFLEERIPALRVPTVIDPHPMMTPEARR